MLENILSGFKTFPEFAGIIYRNCCCELEMCVDILRCLRDMVRRKRPQKLRTSSLFLLHDNAPAHRSVLVKDFFLAKKSVTNLEHPPISRPGSS